MSAKLNDNNPNIESSSEPISASNNTNTNSYVTTSTPHYASAVTFLLSNHEKFGFSERACYHFDLVETLTQQPDPLHRRGLRTSTTKGHTTVNTTSYHNNSNRKNTNASPATVVSEGEEQASTTVTIKDEQSENRHQKSRTRRESKASLSDANSNTKDSENNNHNYNDNDETISGNDDEDEATKNKNSYCGVVGLLECMPQERMRQKNKRSRLVKRIIEFNQRAHEERHFHFDNYNTHQEDDENKITDASLPSERYCYEPKTLPLHLTFNTRVSFVYELTRMVFCIDASPTLTTTFGNLGTLQQTNDGCICALDRLNNIVHTYFQALLQPITGAIVPDGTVWTPNLAVTVIAVYPQSITMPSSTQQSFHVLVQDFRITDLNSANHLSHQISDWALTHVESEIAKRFSSRGGSLDSYSSSLDFLLEACDVASSTLPSEGRPCIVICTDCRAVSCETTMEFILNGRLLDTPLHILDLSGSKSHFHHQHHQFPSSFDDVQFLTFDHDGPSSFPLILSDDCEALYNICQVTRGCFLDMSMVEEASKTIACEDTKHDSIFQNDVYFSLKRSALRPNALQWLTIFSLSPLCPLQDGVICPRYMKYKRDLIPSIPANNVTNNSANNIAPGSSTASKVMIFSYNCNPVRVKSVLLMRIIDGYRIRRYGYNSQDPDKVSIQFTLPLGVMGVTIHNEFSFVSSPYHHPLVGNSHSKISISGYPTFLQLVKNEFMHYSSSWNMQRVISSVAQQVSHDICRFLEWQRDEDIIESQLCPLEWGGVTLYESSTFMKRLNKLSNDQFHRHYRVEHFEVICCFDEDIPINANENHAEIQLFDIISSWSMKEILEKKLYFKKLTSVNDLINYCLVEVEKTHVYSIFSIKIHFFDQVSTDMRLSALNSLKKAIMSCWYLSIAPRPFSELVSLVPIASLPDALNKSQRVKLLESLYYHERWYLVQDAEILPLMKKRRMQYGDFWLLDESKESYAVLSKFVEDDNRSDPVLYVIQMLSESYAVDLLMGYAKGSFLGNLDSRLLTRLTLYPKILDKVKERDQKCGRALRSRRRLLEVFQESREHKADSLHFVTYNSWEDVERLLAYATNITRSLRFFGPKSGQANKILCDLTISMMLSDSFEFPVAKLSFERDHGIDTMGPGLWFLIQHDSENMILIHFPHDEKTKRQAPPEEPDFYVRELTFFTIHIGQLYHTQADIVVDDDCHQDVNSQEKQIINLIDALENAHGYNYALASYLALREKTDPSVQKYMSSDFQHVLQHCDEVIIAKDIFIEYKHQNIEGVPDTASKLIGLIRALLTPIPGGDPYFYFHGMEEYAIENRLKLSIDGVSEVLGQQTDSEYDEKALWEILSASTSELNDSDLGDSQHTIKFEILSHNLRHLTPPVFVKFTFDGIPFSHVDLSRIQQDGFLSVFVTVFNKNYKHPDRRINLGSSPIHEAVTKKLVSDLNSFVAEQTLERIRHEATILSKSNVQIVKKCLFEADNTISEAFPLYFYSSKSDSFIDTSNPIGMEHECLRNVSILRTYLEDQRVIEMLNVEGDFFVSKSEFSGWCYINLPMKNSLTSVHVFHPAGRSYAKEMVSKIRSLLEKLCYRVNQRLLLESLHKVRSASVYLLPLDTSTEDYESEETPAEKDEVSLSYTDGHFQCPIRYQISFRLNRRCPISKASMELKGTILQNFAISNRRGYFVYKDEEDKVFYMKLESQHTSDGDSIDLLIFGENMSPITLDSDHEFVKVDNSVSSTEVVPNWIDQLNRLIEKKIMSMTVEAIALVLAKNPRCRLLPSDMSFLYSFQRLWTKEESINNGNIYELPSVVDDPVLLLLYFRQNICGSTFFNVLREASEGDDADLMKKDQDSTKKQNSLQTDGNKTAVNLNPREFYLCYSASQFQLDFQTVSTLTHMGKEYSQKAGTGIALIEVKLLDVQNKVINQIPLCTLPSKGTIGINSLRLKLCDTGTPSFTENKASNYRICVKIINTTLQADILHRWIELTLNQSLASWTVERLIYTINKGFAPPNDTHSNLMLSRINNCCSGLLNLGYILESSHDLPHPGIQKIEFQSYVKSTSISQLTFHLLERGIIQLLFGKTSNADTLGLSIIRLCGRDSVHEVRFAKDINSDKAQVLEARSQKVIHDSPAASPEYVCCYGFGKSRVFPSANMLLFPKVFVDDINPDSSYSLLRAIKEIQSSNSSYFTRRAAFVLKVSRYTQSILFYNWNPQFLQNITPRLKEIHEDFLKVYVLRQASILVRSVCNFVDTPESKEKNEKKVSFRTVESNHNKTNSNSSLNQDLPSSSDKKKAGAILMPTIVGKSVKGSAATAMAMSRHRASSRAVAASKMKVTSSKAKEEKVTTKPKAAIFRDKITDEKKSILNYLPAALVKEYRILQIPNQSRLLVKHSLHHLILKWFSSLDGKLIPIEVMKYVLPTGTIIHSTIHHIPNYVVANIPQFASYLSKTISTEDSKTTVISQSLSHERDSCQSFFLMKNINVINTSKQCAVVMEVNIYNHRVLGNLARCCTWMFLSTIETERLTKEHISSISKHRQSFTNRKLERKATTVTLGIGLSTQNVNLSVASMNFVSMGIRRALKWQNLIESKLDISTTVNELMSVYPNNVQISMPSSSWYRLLHRPLYCDKKIFELGANESLDALLNYLQLNASKYKLIDCSNSTTFCVVGSLPGQYPNLINFFLKINRMKQISQSDSSIDDKNTNEEAKVKLELFLLCFRRGISLERYILDGKSPVIKLLSDHLLSIATEVAQDIFTKAIQDYHIDSLWDKYSHKVDSVSHAEVVELCSASSCILLSEMDPRLVELLNEANDELNIDWSLAMEVLSKDETQFTNHVSYSTNPPTVHVASTSTDDANLPNAKKIYLFYKKDDDLFVMIELDHNNNFINGRLVCRQCCRYENQNNVNGVSNATITTIAADGMVLEEGSMLPHEQRIRVHVQFLAEFLLSWIWDNS